MWSSRSSRLGGVSSRRWAVASSMASGSPGHPVTKLGQCAGVVLVEVGER